MATADEMIEICRSKSAFGTAMIADHAAILCEGRHKKKLRSYRCPVCLRWHLTSKEPLDKPAAES